MNHRCRGDLNGMTFDQGRCIQPIPSSSCQWISYFFGPSQNVNLADRAIFTNSQLQLNDSRHASEYFSRNKRAGLSNPLRRFGRVRWRRR
jgi:hypothetical protein